MLRALAPLGVGLLLAWLLYYRHVSSLTAASLARVGN
jgi:hypothetical protein